jgi:uncharacterized RDD family membrane protein YckC
VRQSFWTLLTLAVAAGGVCFVYVCGAGVSNQFLDLNPGMPPYEVLQRLGPRLILASLAFFVVLSWMYFALFESSRWRATPGKRLLGIYVVDEGGRPVSFWRASRRFAGGRLLLHVPQVGIYYFLVDCGCVGLFAKEAERCMIFGGMSGSAGGSCGEFAGDRARAS